MASVMCAHGEVGQGTIVMGASGSYVIWLASFLNDHDYPRPTDGGDWAGYTYAVICTVDARDFWEYRTVTLNLQNSNASDPSYARSLQGHEPCYPIPGTSAINDGLIATSAAANGLLYLLSDLADNWRPLPYAFNNSVNALGLISALVASRINSSTVAVDGTVVITATTVGSRKAFSFAFIVPPVAAAIVLFYLILTTRAIKNELYSSAWPVTGHGDRSTAGRFIVVSGSAWPVAGRGARSTAGRSIVVSGSAWPVASRRAWSSINSGTVYRCLRQRLASRRAWR